MSKSKKTRRSKAEEENLIAEMLDDLAGLTGIDVGDMLTDIPEEKESEFETFEVDEEPTEDEPLDTKNPDGGRTDEYFDVLFDDIGVDSKETIREEVAPSP